MKNLLHIVKTSFFLLPLFYSLTHADIFIEPLKPIENIHKEKAELGKLLFFDPILSKDKKISCASCHKAEYGWADNTKVSLGVYAREGKVNSPTVLNAVYNFKQFWNGRVSTLQEQVEGPIHQSFEMDMNRTSVESRLNKSELYRTYFKNIYHKKSIVFSDVTDAIAEYEKTLTTENSRFDRYLKGELALSKEEKQGYKLFRTYGCITCHNGTNIGGNSFQKIGIVVPYENCFSDRYAITNREFDKCVYKVPTLRNISKTAPYFHDGSEATLVGAIKTMAYHNLGIELEEKDVKSIEAFLKSLDAKISEDK